MRLTHDVLNQQVDDLRDRMRLLQQDRRANVDLLEASKCSNSEEIRSFRDENKKLRVKLTQLQKRLSTERGEQHELVIFQREALHLRTDYDTLKVTSNKHQDQMNKLLDDAKVCELEARKPRQEDGPLARKIRMLENKLDKAMIKYNEAQSIRSTYAHIVKRLKEERISFNNQLTALERTLKAKKRDHDEILLLSGDAGHAREIAQHELQQARSAYEDKRARRSGEMRERQQVVRIRRQMLDKQERRDVKKKELLEQQAEKLKRDAANDRLQPYSILHDKERVEEQERKLGMYETAFRKIQETTGVSGVDDIIEKIQGQTIATTNLQTLTKQNRLHVKHLNKEKEDLSKAVEERKFCSSMINVSRKTFDEKEEQLASSNGALARTKSRYDRSSSVLMSAKSGVKHLQQKIIAIGQDTDVQKGEFLDSNLASILWSTGNVMVEIMARIRDDEMVALHDIDGSNLPLLGTNEMNTSLEYETKLQGLRPFNQRISLPSARDNLFENDSSSEVFNDVDEEELSRDRVKKASTQLIRAQKKIIKAKELVQGQ